MKDSKSTGGTFRTTQWDEFTNAELPGVENLEFVSNVTFESAWQYLKHDSEMVSGHRFLSSCHKGKHAVRVGNRDVLRVQWTWSARQLGQPTTDVDS
jgi:hypothetical protein